MVPSTAARGGKTTKTAAITTSSIKVPRSHVDIVIDKLHPSIHTSLFGGGSSSSSSNDDNNNSPINDECNDYNSRRACLVANANEALRILQAKRAHFGVKDKPLVRAALVIDYLCRNNATTNNDTTTSNECNYHRTAIPAATLATIAGFTSSKKDKQILEVMQTVLAEHLDESSIGIRLTKQQQREVYRSTSKQHDDNEDSRNCSTGISRKRDASLLSSSSSSSRPKSKTTTTTTKMTMNTTRTSILKPTNLVQELCITLGPSIPDAEYALAYAIDIFHFLAHGGEKNSTTKNDNNNNNNNTFTTYELRRDMERHTRYYEAACFYLAVKKSEGRNGSSYTFPTAAAASNKKKKKKATRKKKEEEAWKDNNISSSGVMQESQQLEEEDGDIDNENDERHLTELDVIRETNLLEGTFMTVLACIRDAIDGIVIPSSFDYTRKRGVDANSLGDGGSSTKSGGSTLFDVAGEMKTRDRNSSSSNAIAITTTVVDNTLDNVFEQWKRVVLLEAKTAYKNTTMTNEVGRHQAAADDDDSNCWLTHAADNVLRNYGFPL